MKKGMFTNRANPTATRFLFTNEDGIPVGTLKLLPFQPQTFTTINDMFAFDKHTSVIAVEETAYEIIAAMAVLKEILAAIVHFASANYITQYVTMLDSLFLRVLRIQFGS